MHRAVELDRNQTWAQTLKYVGIPANFWKPAWEQPLNLYKALAILGIAGPLFAQDTGPAILSRGEAPPAMASPDTEFRPFLTVTGTYDTGLAGVAVNSEKQLVYSSSSGVRLDGGITGTHSWEHTKIMLTYAGSVIHYFQLARDTTSQNLSLDIIHQFTPHVVLDVKESGALLSQNYSSLGQTGTSDASQSNAPAVDFFNNRSTYLNTQADLIVQESARLSFDIGATGSLCRLRSSGLYGDTYGNRGASARGDVQYRLSEFTTIGAVYNYWNYSYTGTVGNVDIHDASGTFAAKLSPQWEFSGYAGFARLESKFVQSIPLTPVVEQFLGISSEPAVLYGVQYIPIGTARLSRTFRTGVFSFTGEHTVTPGNGLFLTSKMIRGSLSYTYTGLRYWSFAAQALYERGTSLANATGTYGDFGGNVSVSRQIASGVHFVAGADVRRYQSPDIPLYNRIASNVHIGLGFVPGSVPLRFW